MKKGMVIYFEQNTIFLLDSGMAPVFLFLFELTFFFSTRRICSPGKKYTKQRVDLCLFFFFCAWDDCGYLYVYTYYTASMTHAIQYYTHAQ